MKKTQRRWKRTAAGILAAFLIVMAPAGSRPVYAGPADELGQDRQDGPAGPMSQGAPAAEGSNVTSSVPIPAMDDGNYYNQDYGNRIVTPVDRYSYDYMVHDLQIMQERYGNLIQGAIHGREYIVIPLIMRQIETLLAGAANGGTYNGQPVSELLSQVCIHFVPIANPDGVSISQFGEAGLRTASLIDFARSAYQMDVQNQRTVLDYLPYLATWKANARGVDLNHNFDADWSQMQDAGYGRGIGYKGTSPLSESESKALAELCQSQSFDAVISYHTMGNVIYWDTKNNKAAQQSLDLARLVSGMTGYSIQPSLGVGGLKDWLQKKHDTVPSITIEVGKSQSPVDFNEYETILNQNKMIPALIASYVK